MAERYTHLGPEALRQLREVVRRELAGVQGQWFRRRSRRKTVSTAGVWKGANCWAYESNNPWSQGDYLPLQGGGVGGNKWPAAGSCFEVTSDKQGPSPSFTNAGFKCVDCPGAYLVSFYARFRPWSFDSTEDYAVDLKWDRTGSFFGEFVCDVSMQYRQGANNAQWMTSNGTRILQIEVGDLFYIESTGDGQVAIELKTTGATFVYLGPIVS